MQRKKQYSALFAGQQIALATGSRKLFSLKNLVQIRVAFLLSGSGWPKGVITTELPEILRRKTALVRSGRGCVGPCRVDLLR
jgi:hypothetical protein